jgi:omega-amidase
MEDCILAAGQWPVSPDKISNLDRAEQVLREAARLKARLCVLPEMFQTPYEIERFRAAAEYADGPSLTRVRALAQELRLHVVAGSIPERAGEKVFNSSFVVAPDGSILGAHRKIHLFDVDIPAVRVRESDVVSPGDRPLVLELPFCRLGVAICYDARFAAIFRYFEDRGVEVVAVPAAFSRTTGAAHWHALMRTRAVESQVYLAAVCSAPSKSSEYLTYGHSLIIDPWGTVLAEAGEGAEVIHASVSSERLAAVRRELPLLTHRRPEIYRRWGAETGADGAENRG